MFIPVFWFGVIVGVVATLVTLILAAVATNFKKGSDLNDYQPTQAIPPHQSEHSSF